MPKYDIASFRKIVEDIKVNYKPELSTKTCLLCNNPLSECKNCPVIFASDSEYEIPKILPRDKIQAPLAQKTTLPFNQPAQKPKYQPNQSWVRKEPSQNDYQKEVSLRPQQTSRDYYQQQSKPWGRNQQYSYNDRQRDKPWVQKQPYNNKESDQMSFARKPPIPSREDHVDKLIITKQVPVELNVAEKPSVNDLQPNVKNLFVQAEIAMKSQLNAMSEVFIPRKVCPLEVCTPPPMVINKDNKRKRTSSTNSGTLEAKRRKKAEQVVYTFSQILSDLNVAIDRKEDVGSSIKMAIESINSNMDDYASSLAKSRSNINLNFDGSESIKNIVYKTLSDEIQSLHELSTILHGKWRKMVIETGTVNALNKFQEKRKDYPDEFLTTLDDEIEEELLALKKSEGKPNDIIPILNKINDAEYSIQFLSFVKGIKTQGGDSFKRERIQDIIKEYILEDLNERSQTETRKLTLLSEVFSRSEVDEPIRTIDLAINFSLAKLLQMAKRASKYFTEIYDILQISTSLDDATNYFSRQSRINFKKEESPEAAWKRAFVKHSLSENTVVSPIRSCQANLLPVYPEDLFFDSFTWVLGMSEQFYYDNALMLISLNKEDKEAMKKNIKVNFQDLNRMSITEDFTEVVIIGSGSYGDVYRITKKGTNDHLAIKYMKKFPPGLFQTHFDMIVTFLQERNHIIVAKNSPYIVKFLQSFKIPDVTGFFLIFEWCLSDLRRFINLLSFDDPTNVSVSLWESESNGMLKIFEKAQTKYGIDFLPIIKVYIFEIFCALDFLAKSNIIHQDMKPENVMISKNLHLKVGDFGLVFNTKFITRPQQTYLINVSDLDFFNDEPLQKSFGGTELYSDMELSFKLLKYYYPDDAKEIMYHSDALNYDISMAPNEADFMSDLWAGGIIVSEMLLGGALFLYDAVIESYVRQDMEMSGNRKKAMLEITYLKRNYKRYIVEGLTAFCGEEFRQLTKLLSTIFKPRDQRAPDFVSEKEIYFYKNKIVSKFIDISKIETIDVFSKLNLNSNNAFLTEIPDQVGVLVSKPLREQYPTFGELLKSRMDGNSSDNTVLLDLKPGTDFLII